MSIAKKTVVVSGDVMIDWNMSVDRDEIVAVRSWADTGNVRRIPHWGGAWLLEDLIKRFDSGSSYNVLGIDRPSPFANPAVHQTYTVVKASSDDVLRVDELLGIERRDDMPSSVLANDDAEAAVIALLDSDLGFDKKLEPWPKALAEDGHTPWVILKTSVPDFKQEFWRQLIAGHADRLIVVMTVEDLRRKEIQLIRHLSWERTAQDLINELRRCPALQALRRCKYLIVSFGTEGAMLLTRDEDPRLVFDPAAMEGEWAPEKKPSGRMIGYTTILAAAVVHEVMIHPKWPQLADALPRGIAGMRALFENGFGKDRENPKVNLDEIVAATLKGKKKIVSAALVRETTRKSWTILEDRLTRSAKNFPGHNVEDALYELAARVAVYGPKEELTEVPQLSIGELFTVDREEIESYRSIKVLLTEYVERTPSEPLSIAVFGSPGSGKSFGVKEIVKAIDGKKQITPLTFNLTQFARPEDLRGAFHQIRDVSLRGKIPLVFWDEFDTTFGTQPLGWLRYFISPMQDGQFQEDQITHPIGTSIFVFAGGTATSKDEFVKPDLTAERKALKVPDFISRIKGFLNVTGPNRRAPDGDPHYLIRRAIVLRTMLHRHCPELFRKETRAEENGKKRTVEILQIAQGVLHAFLNTKTYRHGARSLESVIAMSTLAGRKRFVSSSLPPEPQLALHVELPFESPHEYKFTHDVELLEKQAEFAHEVFLKIKKKYGWRHAEIRDDKKSLHNLIVDYADLPENEKEANRSSVRMIPTKVARAGYAIAPAGSAEECRMTEPEIDRLAKHEHNIWMKRKKDAGYERGDEATESPKRSPYLVPWEELEPQWQDVDRGMIRAIPEILAVVEHILVDADDAPSGS
ncbi:MAG: hypothetical protein QOC81_2324 [Thermoanaerobaculia bacterium]|jgi:hypothetical protein|nr:hypothetical protein [Thermoanaerobaculia bacterium]